jgi:nucleotide-binding universal stress UspA family protein
MTASASASEAVPAGPVLFAYDGSALAGLAIQEAGRQLAAGRDAVVLCVWQPADVGFLPVREQHFNAQCAADVHRAAEEVAATGSALAEQAGFLPRSLTVEAAPTWKGIVEVANEHQASLVVLGSHRRTGFRGHLLGSVANAVLAHAGRAVLIVRQLPG